MAYFIQSKFQQLKDCFEHIVTNSVSQKHPKKDNLHHKT